MYYSTLAQSWHLFARQEVTVRMTDASLFQLLFFFFFFSVMTTIGINYRETKAYPEDQDVQVVSRCFTVILDGSACSFPISLPHKQASTQRKASLLKDNLPL